MIDSAGLPLVRIATLIDSPLNTIMALGGGSIHSLADLKGAKIGVSVGGVEDAVLDVMLQSAGLQPSDVTSVKVNYDMVAALLTGASRCGDRGLPECGGSCKFSSSARRRWCFCPRSMGCPPYDELILVAHRKRIADPKLKRFMAALQEGTDALMKSPDAIWDRVRRRPPRARQCAQPGELESNHAGDCAHASQAERATLYRFSEFCGCAWYCREGAAA